MPRYSGYHMCLKRLHQLLSKLKKDRALFDNYRYSGYHMCLKRLHQLLSKLKKDRALFVITIKSFESNRVLVSLSAQMTMSIVAITFLIMV